MHRLNRWRRTARQGQGRKARGDHGADHEVGDGGGSKLLHRFAIPNLESAIICQSCSFYAPQLWCLKISGRMSMSHAMEWMKEFAQSYSPLVVLIATVLSLFGLRSTFWPKVWAKIKDF